MFTSQHSLPNVREFSNTPLEEDSDSILRNRKRGSGPDHHGTVGWVASPHKAKGHQFRFPVKAHAQVVGSFPDGCAPEAIDGCFFLSLPLCLKLIQSFEKKEEMITCTLSE